MSVEGKANHWIELEAEVDQLHEVNEELLNEVEKLRWINAELVAACKNAIENWFGDPATVFEKLLAAIAKAEEKA
jgi:predicted transcriptional regulator